MERFNQDNEDDVNTSQMVINQFKSNNHSIFDSSIPFNSGFNISECDVLTSCLKLFENKDSRNHLKKLIQKISKNEKDNGVNYQMLHFNKSQKDSKSKFIEVQNTFEFRFLCLRGIFKYDIVKNKAVPVLYFNRNDSVFGVDYRMFDFKLFSDKTIKGGIYLISFWQKGKSYMKMILVNEKNMVNNLSGHGFRKDVTKSEFIKNHYIYIDLQENSCTFEDILDCNFLELDSKNKKCKFILLLNDKQTLLLIDFKFNKKFTFKITEVYKEKLKDIQLNKIFVNEDKKILFGLFRSIKNNGIMLFYFKSKPEKNSFLKFKTLNLQKSTSSLIQVNSKENEFLINNLLFKTEPQNHIFELYSMTEGFLLITTKNILFLNTKFKLLRSLNMRHLKLGLIRSFFFYGKDLILNYSDKSYCCPFNSTPEYFSSLDQNKEAQVCSIFIDKFLLINNFVSLSKYEHCLNKTFILKFNKQKQNFQNWYYNNYTNNEHYFESNKSKFKQMIWINQVESSSQIMFAQSLLNIQKYLQKKIIKRFIEKYNEFKSKKGNQSYECIQKSLVSQNFRKYLNDYMCFIGKRNLILEKLFSENLPPEISIYFINSCVDPKDKFIITNKFFQTEDLVEKFVNSGIYSIGTEIMSVDDQLIMHFVSLIYEQDPKGNFHLENSNMLNKYFYYNQLEEEIISQFKDMIKFDFMNISTLLSGISKWVNL